MGLKTDEDSFTEVEWYFQSLKREMGLLWTKSLVNDFKYLMSFVYSHQSSEKFEAHLEKLAAIWELSFDEVENLKKIRQELRLARKGFNLSAQIKKESVTETGGSAWVPISVSGPNASSIWFDLDQLPLVQVRPMPGYGQSEILNEIKTTLIPEDVLRFLNGQLTYVTNVTEMMRLVENYRCHGNRAAGCNTISKFRFENINRFLELNPTPKNFSPYLTIHVPDHSYDSDGYKNELLTNARNLVAHYVDKIKGEHLKDPASATILLYLMEPSKHEAYVRDLLADFHSRMYIEIAATLSHFPESQGLMQFWMEDFITANKIKSPQRSELKKRAPYLKQDVSTSYFCSAWVSLTKRKRKVTDSNR